MTDKLTPGKSGNRTCGPYSPQTGFCPPTGLRGHFGNFYESAFDPAQSFPFQVLSQSNSVGCRSLWTELEGGLWLSLFENDLVELALEVRQVVGVFFSDGHWNGRQKPYPHLGISFPHFKGQNLRQEPTLGLIHQIGPFLQVGVPQGVYVPC